MMHDQRQTNREIVNPQLLKCYNKKRYMSVVGYSTTRARIQSAYITVEISTVRDERERETLTRKE